MIEPIRLLSDQALAELDNTRADTLGFMSYANVISRVVQGTRGPFTIGVFGDWGMGKTSLMRLIEQTVSRETQPGATIITVWFNAWMFEKVEYPVVPLIKSINEALKSHKATHTSVATPLGSLIDALEALVVAFTLRGQVGIPNLAELEMEATPSKALTRYRKRQSERKHSGLPADIHEEVFEAFQNISNQIVPDNMRILVLIDDLDRCFPENAVRLLESIKLVLSQPGFLFILGASRVVIEEYLQSKYEKQYGIRQFDGKAYLDKMIQLSFDIPPHTSRADEFTRRMIEDLGEKQVRESLLPITPIIGETCRYNPRSIIRFINRLITDSAIYAENSDNASTVPMEIFAVTRSLQHSWKDFYGWLIGGDTKEDREYCATVAGWSATDMKSWARYEAETEAQDHFLMIALHKLKHVDAEVLKRIASQLLADKTLKSLIVSKHGRYWLKSHALREASISFLTTQITTGEVVGDSDATDQWLSTRTLGGEPTSSGEELYRQAAEIVITAGKASTSMLQRRLRIGYARAARLIDLLEKTGIVGPADGARPRAVLYGSVDELDQQVMPRQDVALPPFS